MIARAGVIVPANYKPATKTPKLNVIANTNCGYLKYLFAKGYRAAKGTIANDAAIAGQFKNVKTPKPQLQLINRFMKASFNDNSPDANGLNFVLSTFLSISLSHISLTTQPAALMVYAPIPNTMPYFNVCKSKLFAPMSVPQRHGLYNRTAPVGDKYRPSLIYALMYYFINILYILSMV